MTIVKDAYLLDWPETLDAIGEAIESDDQAQFNILLDAFQPSPEKKFFNSDVPEYYVHIHAYRITLPIVYYLLKRNVSRDTPPYDPHKFCNNADLLTDEVFNQLGINLERGFDERVAADPEHSIAYLHELYGIGPDIESIRDILSKKIHILNMMQNKGGMFEYESTENLLRGIPENPFNYLLLQFEDILREYPRECEALINAAMDAGAIVDRHSLYCASELGDYWFERINEMLPTEIKFKPIDVFDREYNGARYGRKLDVNILIELDRLEHAIPEGETSWVHHLSENEELLNELVEQYGHNINHPGEKRVTPLIEAIDELKISTIERLLILGADPNQADLSGNTPLHHAASRGVKRIVSLLLSAGADPKLLNDKYQTPRDLADTCNMSRKNIPMLDGVEALKWTIEEID